MTGIGFYKRSVFMAIFILLVSCVQGIAGDGFLHLVPDRESFYLGRHLGVLPDPDGLLTLQDIMTPRIQAQFKPNQSEFLSLGPAHEVVWLRFRILADTAATQNRKNWILDLGAYSGAERISFYYPDPDTTGLYRLKSTGSFMPSSTRDVAFRNFAFTFSVLPGIGYTYYIRLEHYSPLVTTIKIRSPDAFRSYVMHDYFVYGWIYGSMLAMALYNLFLFFSLRDRLYLDYVLNLALTLAYFMLLNGHLSLFLEWETGRLVVLEWYILGLWIYVVTCFGQHFLNTSEHMPRSNILLTVYKILALVLSAASLSGLFTMASLLSFGLGAVGTVSLLVMAVHRWRQGYGPAKYFILANLCLIVSTNIYVFWGLNMLSSNIPGPMAFTMGPAIDALLLSFALANRIRVLEKEKESLAASRILFKKASETDGLTGLYNKSYMSDHLALEVKNTEQSGRPVSFIIMDIDNFKKLNDTYGHPQGDKVLKSLAEVIRANIRGQDRGCRFGGEEFTVILPDTTDENARNIAERIRKAFASQCFTSKNKEFTSSISIGLAQYQPGEDPADLIERADKALYLAKQQGKNRVVSAG